MQLLILKGAAFFLKLIWLHRRLEGLRGLSSIGVMIVVNIINVGTFFLERAPCVENICQYKWNKY